MKGLRVFWSVETCCIRRGKKEQGFFRRGKQKKKKRRRLKGESQILKSRKGWGVCPPEIRRRLRDNYDEDIPEDVSLLGGQILRTDIGDETQHSLIFDAKLAHSCCGTFSKCAPYNTISAIH